jgi:tetratricopeptide (TPR) repeat protein
MDILPEKERLKINRLKHKTTAAEIADAEDLLKNWEQRVSVKEREILSMQKGNNEDNVNIDNNDIFTASNLEKAPVRRNIPPVRGSSMQSIATKKVVKSAVMDNDNSPTSKEEKGGEERLSGYDFRAWEKFDVDREMEKIEEFDQDYFKTMPGKSREDLEKDANVKRTNAHLKELEQIKKALGSDDLTPLQRSSRANREKIKGNECYKSGEIEEAFHCYSRSIALDPTNAVAYSNRAMAALKLSKLELAEDDCSRAIKLDRSYVKAWSRRGTARFKRGKYREAVYDFEEAIKLHPSSNEYKAMAEDARNKYEEVEGRPLDMGDGVVLVTQCQSSKTFALPPIRATEVESGVLVVTNYVSPAGPIDATPSIEEGGGTFTRIAISLDDDSDSEEEDEEEEEKVSIAEDSTPDITTARAGFTKINIVEESDSEDDEVVDEETEKKAVALKEQGNTLMANGDHNGAIVAYTRSLRYHPKLVASLNNRTMAYLAIKQYAEALRDTNAVLEIEPRNAKALFRRATAQNHLGNYEASLKDLDNVLTMDAANKQAVDLRKAVAAKVSELQLAMSMEFDLDGTKQQIKKLMEQGNYERAIYTLNNALDEDYFKKRGTAIADEQIGLLMLLQACQVNVNKNDAAISTLTTILRIQPENFKAMYRKAELSFANGDVKSASNDLSKLLKIDGSNVEALKLMKAVREESLKESLSFKELGNEAVKDKDFLKAIEMYTKAIESDSSESNILSYNNRAMAYLKLGKNAKAEKDASFVLDKCRGQEDKVSVYKKALYRRACARRDQESLSLLESAMTDFTELITMEPDNKLFQQECAKTQAQLAAAIKKKNPIPPSVDGNQGAGVLTSMPPQAPVASDLKSIGLTEKSVTRRKIPIEMEGDEDEDEAMSNEKVSATEAATVRDDSSSPAAGKKASGKSPTPTKRVSKRPTVPTDAPRTVYELEKVWRALKGYPDLFSQYLSCFKKSTYKKVFKETVSPDLLSSMFVALKDHATADSVYSALDGLSKMANFSMTVALLPAEDMENIKAAITKVDGEKQQALTSLYKL